MNEYIIQNDNLINIENSDAEIKLNEIEDLFKIT